MARGGKKGLIALAGLTAGFLAAGVLVMEALPPASRSVGAFTLLMSLLAGAAGTAILALIMRNPDGSIITGNPDIIRQNRLRNRRWASGSGFAVLLAIGLVLGAARGMLAVVLCGVLTGFGSVILLLALVAHFKLVRPHKPG